MSESTWLITGCSRGFGRALVDAALAAGHCVTATARRTEDLADLAGHPRCEVVRLDITQPDQITAAFAASHARWGRLDVLVGNAGAGLIGAIEECADEQIRRNFETNFFGPLAVVRAALPQLRTQRGGRVFLISAAAAIGNYAGFGVYGAAKAALELAAESLRLELAPLGVRVNLIQPGPFRTGFVSHLEPATNAIPDYAGTAGKFARYLASVDGRQPGDPALAASALVALASQAEAPFRQPLGRYAARKLRDKGAALMREAEAGEALASGADGPPR